MDLIWKTLLDLKQPKILVRLFVPLALGLVLVALLSYGVFGWLLTSDAVGQSSWVQAWSEWQQSLEQTLGNLPIVGGLLLWLLSMVVMLLAGAIGILLGSYLVLIFAMIITGFMTDTLVRAVRDLHYPNLAYAGHGTIWQMLAKQLKFALGILVLFIATLPLLFVPLVNVVWFWLLGFLFFRFALVLDVGMVILPQHQFEQVRPLTNWRPTSALGVLFACSLFPLVSFFAPILGVIAMAHYQFEQLALSAISEDKAA